MTYQFDLYFEQLQDECAGAGHDHGTAGEVDENILHQEACDSRVSHIQTRLGRHQEQWHIHVAN